MNKARSCDG